jgi:excisionase family DNA binding protein
VSIQEALRVLAEQLPAGTPIPVPASVLLDLIDGRQGDQDSSAPSRDLTVDEVAKHFGRSGGTVRSWLDQERFPGAYKLRGRAWRIPPAALRHFVETEKSPRQPAAPGKIVPLDSWRRTR